MDPLKSIVFSVIKPLNPPEKILDPRMICSDGSINFHTQLTTMALSGYKVFAMANSRQLKLPLKHAKLMG